MERVKLHEINCACCGNTLGVVFVDASSSLNWLDPDPVYCYLCAHSICDLVSELGIWDGRPDKHDLYHVVRSSDANVRIRGKFMKQLDKLRSNK